MRFVLRDTDGSILSVHREPVSGAEALPVGHPEVQAFLATDEHHRSFAGLDADLVRVLEDLIDVLIERNVLRITDLPAEAQQKLFARKHFRSRVQSKSLSLFGNELGDLGQDGVVPSVIMDLPDDPI